MARTLHSISSKTYQLLQPGKIQENVQKKDIKAGYVVIEPTLASICHADIRYYAGLRKPEALAKKLPMALLHEGIGTIVESNDSEFQFGQRVVIVPNLPNYLLKGNEKEACCNSCRKGNPDNYCEKSSFMGSGYDGIAQHRVVVPSSCAIPIPEHIPDEIAVLSELCTVSYHALHPLKGTLNANSTRIAVFGDGPVGYLTAAMLRFLFGVDYSRLLVFGAIPEKLSHFTFATCQLVHEVDFKKTNGIDVAIDCTGGIFSESAINQAINLLYPGGSLILMGVSEDRVPINTRDILEKGISLYGSSRSSVPDYHAVMEAFENLNYQHALKEIIPDHYTSIYSAHDFQNAMNDASNHKGWKKTILDFKWS
ncbi:hypothetical protein M948_00825 [Virgibacillus sp. CM-4]|uniref:alcohol dehydrogenase catalytic domain-containing protein n=1 Tax=Virgibacillus sp. CM-4 TaxID=1354277 RepID=UPI00038853DA|nr:alcohol dehydrogenase catalytic domain-containing protein [Virgibacillus sp. CM-4]EQB38920.1 hypothetical protein M948_00825 [Virgibacillus sp. CM-4]